MSLLFTCDVKSAIMAFIVIAWMIMAYVGIACTVMAYIAMDYSYDLHGYGLYSHGL